MNNICKELNVKILDIDANKPIIVLSKKTANEILAKSMSRITVSYKKKEIICILDIDRQDEIVNDNEIGLFRDVYKKLNVKENEIVSICLTPYPESIQYIVNKINNQPLTKEQMLVIIKDVVNNKISDIEISAFLTAVNIFGLNIDETYYLANALVETGETISFDDALVLDKHSVGGINGRASMIIVPIIASLGYKIPKTSSRSISSAAGTADAMEVLSKITFTVEEFKEIINKTNGMIAWNGKFNLCPGDDALIKVRHSLGFDPEGLVIASVLAKKKSVGATHLVIDLPLGKETKIKSKEDAERWAKKFFVISKKLGIKTKVIITDAEGPNGSTFGASLETKTVLEILEGKFFDNLAHKSCLIAGALLELIGHCKEGEGYNISKEIITSGKALQKFKEIIKAQSGNIFSSKEISEAKYKKTISCGVAGIIKNLNVELLTKSARIAGAPYDKEAGLIVFKKIGDSIDNINEPLLEIHANEPSKLAQSEKLIIRHLKEIIEIEN